MQPQHVSTAFFWSFPVKSTQFEQMKTAQVFHVDIDDYRVVKFFFYLTDVDSSTGPHVYIRGTHKGKTLFHQFLGGRCASLDDQEIVSCYGLENVITVYGKAGSGFVGNPYCFHKGMLPTNKDRLLLLIEFARADYQVSLNKC